jgi:hypothetical protein
MPGAAARNAHAAAYADVADASVTDAREAATEAANEGHCYFPKGQYRGPIGSGKYATNHPSVADSPG